MLKALNIAYLEKEGYEADDVIGTLATRAEAAGFEVLICTGDRDISSWSATASPCCTRAKASPIWPA